MKARKVLTINGLDTVIICLYSTGTVRIDLYIFMGKRYSNKLLPKTYRYFVTAYKSVHTVSGFHVYMLSGLLTTTCKQLFYAHCITKLFRRSI